MKNVDLYIYNTNTGKIDLHHGTFKLDTQDNDGNIHKIMATVTCPVVCNNNKHYRTVLVDPHSDEVYVSNDEYRIWTTDSNPKDAYSKIKDYIDVQMSKEISILQERISNCKSVRDRANDILNFE